MSKSRVERMEKCEGSRRNEGKVTSFSIDLVMVILTIMIVFHIPKKQIAFYQPN